MVVDTALDYCEIMGQLFFFLDICGRCKAFEM